jgi:hypothetical protein
LAPDWQSAPVAQPSVGTKIHEPFDVHGHFPAEIAFHDEA